MRELDVADRAQPPVDVRVGADDLDREAGHAALAQLLEHARDAVDAADPSATSATRGRPALAARPSAVLLAPEERGRGRVGHRGGARAQRRGGRRQQRQRAAPVPAAAVASSSAAARLALVRAPRAAEERVVAEAVLLHERQQARPSRWSSRPRPATRPAAPGASAGPRSAPSAPARASPSASTRSTMRRTARGSGPSGSVAAASWPSARTAMAMAAWAHFAARALLAARAGQARADEAQERLGAVGARRLGPRAPDVDAGVVVRAADPGPAVGLDVDRRRAR